MTDYKPTQEEIRRFGIHKKYGVDIADKKPIVKKARPTNGQLVYECGNYKEVVKGMYDKPFGILQKKKKEMLANGYKAENLKIRNL